jgi:DNA invertase Pin-like site-specific DNA recombinase
LLSSSASDTGERIRDKIAASKKKGLWMGGNPPLGYRPRADAHHTAASAIVFTLPFGVKAIQRLGEF